jgi:peroxiredoxin
MVALETPAASVGWKAEDFNLKGTDGNLHTLASVKGPKGVLVMFICNHCPYVQKQLGRMIEITNELKRDGIGVVGINSNDTAQYPEDSYPEMCKLATEMKFPFPYLIDESQAVARAYRAVCTPDFFGFNANLELQYRGRLDESWSLAIKDPKRELLEAMREVATTGKTTRPQNPSVGCSIKWRRAA